MSTPFFLSFSAIGPSLSAKDVVIPSGINLFSARDVQALLNDVGVPKNLPDTGIGADVLTNAKYVRRKSVF